jgi:hypothetical protein
VLLQLHLRAWPMLKRVTQLAPFEDKAVAGAKATKLQLQAALKRRLQLLHSW